MMRTRFYILTAALLLAACHPTGEQKQQPEEDLTAKRMLQGIWLDADDEEPTFRIEGDTIYYPDSTSVPAAFKVIEDTLLVGTESPVKYPIVRQTEHIFEFRNLNGDVVKLQKSDDQDDKDYFGQRPPVAINQRTLIKRDTIVGFNQQRYHCYIQVNPTTYKVIKPNFNDDGLRVDNIYYDNIIHLSIFKGAARIYSRDFRKADFARFVPADILKQSILSDIVYEKADDGGIHHTAQLCIPDSPSSYVVDIAVGYGGEMKMDVAAY